jgi:membrane-associated protein
MNIFQWLIEFVLHLDKNLALLISQIGAWTYVPLFLIVFLETGFVVTPFLPGDSLLFAAGSMAALDKSPINIFLLYGLMALAAIIGDTVNYWIGHAIGPRVFTEKIRFLKKEYLDRTHVFYEKHGGMTIFLARFIPIIRTFAPFIAGVGAMTYRHFILYNVVGGLVWAALFTFGGYFFGQLPFVKDHFSIVIIAIILISLVPAVIEAIKVRKESVAKT